MAATQDTLATFGNVDYANSKQLITKVPDRSGRLIKTNMPWRVRHSCLSNRVKALFSPACANAAGSADKSN
jgi:hypothetical protein